MQEYYILDLASLAVEKCKDLGLDRREDDNSAGKCKCWQSRRYCCDDVSNSPWVFGGVHINIWIPNLNIDCFHIDVAGL